MRLRTQLLVAFCLLAILPLAAIVLYSYLSTQEAFRSGVEAESAALAEAMKDRLGSDRQQVRRQLNALGRPAVGKLVEDLTGGVDLPDTQAILAEVQAELGELAPFIDRLEFVVEGLSLAPPAAPGASEPTSPPSAIPPPRPKVGALVLEPEEIRTGPHPPALTVPAPPAVHDLVLRRIVRGSEELQLFLDEVEPKKEASQKLSFPLRAGEEAIGQVRASLSSSSLLAAALAQAPQDGDALSFALDAQGTLYTPPGADRAQLEKLLAAADLSAARGSVLQDGWILVSREELATGAIFGVARPVGEALQKIRQAAVRNLVFGIVLVGLAFLGVLPLTAHITRHLSALTRGAERIAAGDLQARVPVHSENEIGQLARTFNRMAYELSENQRQLLDGERRRQEQQIQQRLLEAENHRKTQELEEARAFQLSLLPKALPRPRGLKLAAFTRTATEVGGDYYDFHGQGDGSLTIAIGDATGHGARAGTMVAVIKSLFSSYGAQTPLPRFLTDAARTIKGMGLRRMAMSLALVRLRGRQLSVSSAGMPPVLIFRAAGGEVEEVLLEGMPLGGLDGYPYRQFETALETGDTLLLMSDGLPEMLQPEGDAVGYVGVQRLFRQAAAEAAGPEEIVQALVAAVDRLTGTRPLADDTTFVVVRVLEDR